jgi:O-antigen/teichoic acid export membrane protein
MKKSIFTMSVLNFFNYIAPFILIPLITNEYGPSGFGTYGLSLLYGSYIGLLVEYGFNFQGVRDHISINSNKERTRLYVRVFIAKLFFFIVGLVIILILFSAKLILVKIEFIFPAILGFGFQALVPNWFHQAREDFSSIFISVVISKLIYFGAALLFILNSYPIYYILWGLVLSNLIGLIISNQRSKIKLRYFLDFKLFSEIKLMSLIKKTTPFFIVTTVPHLYSSLIIFHAGYYIALEKIGFLIAAERIFFVFKQLSTPFLQVFFPRYQIAIKSEDLKQIKQINKSFLMLLISVICFAALISIGANQIILTYYGNEFESSGAALSILIIATPFIILTNYFGVQVLFSRGKENITAKVMLYVGILMQTCVYFFINSDSEITTIAYFMLLGEVLTSLIITLYGIKIYTQLYLKPKT